MSDSAVLPTVDIAAILEKEDVSMDLVLEARTSSYASLEQRAASEEVLRRLERGLVKFSAENRLQIRRATVLWILGRNDEAIELLKSARANRESQLVLGLATLEKGAVGEALPVLEKAADGETDAPLATLGYVEALNKLGQHEDAYAYLQKVKKAFDKSADYHYVLGFTLDHIGRYADADEAYHRALHIAPEHAKSLFRIAYNAELRGDDTKALDIYERLRKNKPPAVNALLNLGLLYEDRCQFEKAIDCYQTILDTFPQHERSQLYLSDARASLSMYYDEEARKKEHRVGQMLNTPISEFQLSVRSRNCLAKIGVNTLGDLTRKSEAELVGCKNFGETSLKEVKELLRHRGVTLAKPEVGVAAKPKPAPILSGTAKDDVLARPLSEFEWSARARKCLDRLGLQTMGELAAKSEQDLLSVRNFGLTSLNEIKQRLTAIGLSLRTGK